MRGEPGESETVFQRGDLDKNVNVQEIPDFSDKGCMWLWSWCIGPVVKLVLWMFQNYMALKTGYGYMVASNSHINITTGSNGTTPEYDLDDLGIKLRRNNSDCGELNSYSPDDGLFFAKWTFCICLIPTVLLSSLFLMDFRKTLKQAKKWTWCHTLLFVFGMITQSGYFIKHVAMIVYGVRARRLLRKTNNPFDEDVQREWYLHRHAQSHLEHMRRIEALIKLVPQTILQLYIIWYVIDHTEQDLDSQLRCLKPTWILTGVSILKFSLDASLNVKEFDLHGGIRYFKRHELDEAVEFYSENSPAGKTPLCLLYNMCAITSRCIFVSLMFYYMPSHYPHVLTLLFLAHLILMALPTALIGSYMKSLFEEIGRKVERKNRKLLWTCWYFIMVLPWILIMWTSSLYSWVDVYGIPAKKPCEIEASTTKRRRRVRTNYGYALFYYFCLIFLENLVFSGYFYLYRKQIINSGGEGTLGFREIWWTFSVAWMSGTLGLVLGCLYYFCICKIDSEKCNLNQPNFIFTALK